ncbi:MAG TPA: LuxR C-terminal-related transcriptional regulator [Polyangiales bacterium]|nr:LuxR C-terminal-related transcriptional regulator [Polyangiales bacterium]
MPAAEQFIDATLRLGHEALGASRVAFYRVDDALNLHDFACSGVPSAFHRLYVREMFELDPLHARRISGLHHDITPLEVAVREAPADHVAEYLRYLRSFGIVDSTELLFRDGARVVAGLSLMWTREDRPRPASDALARALSRYIQFNFLEHCTRAGAARAGLDRYGLSRRETEVAELLCVGYTNAEIARALELSLATVKTHVLHIYAKCRVRTRAGLTHLLHR